MNDAEKAKRQLKIKTGVVNRLWKEHTLYKKETEDNQVKLDQMKADPEADEWKIGNQGKLIQESEKMVLDTQKRLTSAVAELRELVAHTKTHTVDFQDSEELHNAEAALYESSI
ncbi:hypothetical protein FRC14_002703 [Serendipita sp. 396]|nr:hypothetical protein FRC14_002703 [Serendipita sp. 396]KAG8789752.1 hypothetical protein FRC15_003821 [Serendipita sp. 397]KAG8804290.1 hypothetical protein FRC16_010619 [Serendipita sp. 398]KAG8810395.1 hypothetical protein FRC18_004080 [Serendipita sp. 400]KAG8819507.1 hypothetical protein FRC19_009737 [Serendipita sp. 401]KAG8877476.1 hypothetical protein FRC20_011145 [Serendipita sp. 405]KAG9052947.1 hypothetical protein FS842_008981 [Serendipita sp. 407]